MSQWMALLIFKERKLCCHHFFSSFQQQQQRICYDHYFCRRRNQDSLFFRQGQIVSLVYLLLRSNYQQKEVSLLKRKKKKKAFFIVSLKNIYNFEVKSSPNHFRVLYSWFFALAMINCLLLSSCYFHFNISHFMDSTNNDFFKSRFFSAFFVKHLCFLLLHSPTGLFFVFNKSR